MLPDPEKVDLLEKQADDLFAKSLKMFQQAAEYQRGNHDSKAFDTSRFERIMSYARKLFDKAREIETEVDKIQFGSPEKKV